jgi:putative FmdB family regulatory protein
VPTYAYACTACGHRFEVQQSFSDAALTECPECEGRLRKLFNTVGIVFKGSGFYRTDSRNGSSSPATAAKDNKENKEKQATDSGSAGSSDSKPAAKSETVKASSSSGEKAA